MARRDGVPEPALEGPTRAKGDGIVTLIAVHSGGLGLVKARNVFDVPRRAREVRSDG